jgi:uncharacterized ferritin-like protein (DUF455 family)
MKLSELTKSILCGDTLDDKLISFDSIEFDTVQPFTEESPARSGKIEFSEKQVRFPKGNFHEKKRTAMALNAFANHELLAVEIMAFALVLFEHNTEEEVRFKKGILSSLKDEQKHFRLYANRMKQLGYEFGDFHLNDFFWKHMKDMKTPSEYLSMMALTFEAANLDFSFHYEKIFRELGDTKTADVLKVVYEDEISHVGFGVNYLNRWREDESLWNYYLKNLPFPLSPARAKGKNFIEESRIRAKMDSEFISHVREFKTDYRVSIRKEWK